MIGCRAAVLTSHWSSSSGAYTDQKIATTDVGGGCTLGHTGTSAAAPLAAGILALVLEVECRVLLTITILSNAQANPLLSWRDVQHLVVHAANPQPVLGNQGWAQNGAGRWYNPRSGDECYFVHLTLAFDFDI